jgi:hypothetical protein
MGSSEVVSQSRMDNAKRNPTTNRSRKQWPIGPNWRTYDMTCLPNRVVWLVWKSTCHNKTRTVQYNICLNFLIALRKSNIVVSFSFLIALSIFSNGYSLLIITLCWSFVDDMNSLFALQTKYAKQNVNQQSDQCITNYVFHTNSH